MQKTGSIPEMEGNIVVGWSDECISLAEFLLQYIQADAESSKELVVEGGVQLVEDSE